MMTPARTVVGGTYFGCLVFIIKTVARCDEGADDGFVTLFNGKDSSGWLTRGI
jgi:hypothetical protein